MVHEESSTLIAGFLHFIIIMIVIGTLIAIALGRIDLKAALTDIDHFEIARSTPIFEEVESPVQAAYEPVQTVRKPKPKPKKPKIKNHPSYKEFVLTLVAVGTPVAEAKRTARRVLSDNPDIADAEEFIRVCFARNM